MPELISAPITPHPGTSDTSRMGRGEPGLPSGYVWRGTSYDVLEELDARKESSREGARTGGELSLRRHYFRLRMSDDTIWTVYCARQTPRSGDPKKRWFLYTIEPGETSKSQNVKIIKTGLGDGDVRSKPQTLIPNPCVTVKVLHEVPDDSLVEPRRDQGIGNHVGEVAES